MTSKRRKASISRKKEELIWKLPTDILFRILSRLPLKTLCRCRLVCKYLFQTIQNPDFASNYHNINKNNDNNLYLLLNVGMKKHPRLVDCELGTIYTPRLPISTSIWLTSGFETISCNGLLLLIPDGKYCHDYCICNPITGDHIAVPRPPLSPLFKLEPTDNRIVFTVGFGYDPVHNVSKIIIISSVVPRRSTWRPCVEIWNLVTNKWRVMEEDQLLVKPLYPNTAPIDQKPVSVGSYEHMLDSPELHVPPPVLVHGALHWMAYLKGLHRRHPPTGVIISNNLETDEFHQLQVPRELIFKRRSLQNGEVYLLAVCDCLGLVQIVGKRKKHTDIWIMKDYGRESSWVKQYTIEYIVGPSGSMGGHYAPIKFMENKGILLCFDIHDQLCCYNPITKATKPYWHDCSSSLKGGFKPSKIHSLDVHTGSPISPRSIGNIIGN